MDRDSFMTRAEPDVCTLASYQVATKPHKETHRHLLQVANGGVIWAAEVRRRQRPQACRCTRLAQPQLQRHLCIR